MKLVIALLTLTFVTACASKKTEPVKTETPATMAAEKPSAPVEVKKAEKHAKKSGAKKTTEAAPAEKSSVGKAELTCKSGTEERKLAIQVKGTGCELMYTKGGETKAIATQMNGSEKCEEVMTSVKEKLVAANYTCQ